MTMSTSATGRPAGGCGGDGCDVGDPWPLHHVRHRGNFCRLCTSCVLKYHPGSFCVLCFALVDAGSPASPPAGGLIQCSKCPSVSHRSCLPRPDLASLFVCPSCKNPEGFSYFPKDSRSDGKRRMINLDSAKVLLVAARLAANSMSRAATVARVEAERKVKEAANAKKRARDLLEKALVICKKENERNAVAAAGAAATNPKPAAAATNSKPAAAATNPKPAAAATNPKPAAAATNPKPAAAPVVEERKKKVAKVGSNGAEQKRTQSREIEKWMRVHEPITPATVAQGEGEKDKTKGGAQVEVKSRVPGGLAQVEKDKKGNSLSSQSGGGPKEEEKSLAGGAEKGPRLPQAPPDALVSRANPRPIITSSPGTASLRS